MTQYIINIALSLLAVATIALAWSFTPKVLKTPKSGDPILPPMPKITTSISVIETGSMESNALFAYRGGNLEKRIFGMDVFVVQHGEDTILFEAGFGCKLSEHLKSVNWLMRAVSKVNPNTTLIDQLAEGGVDKNKIKGIFLTHTHWDHVGALEDLPGIPVYVNQVEREYIENGGSATELIRSFNNITYQVYDFNGPAFAGYERSYDVFGDGSVVLVPAGGHTPGAAIAFIRTPNHDYALIGDQAWQKEGVEIPAEKPWISRQMVDEDPEGVRVNLVKLHQLKRANSRLVIVPSHDRRVTSEMPRFSQQ